MQICNNDSSQSYLLPLLTGDSYCSQKRNSIKNARLYPSVIFYCKLLYTFWRAAKLTKHGIYDNQSFSRDMCSILCSLEDLGLRFEIENMNSFKYLDRPCVFISNHMSTLETLILPAIILPNRDITYVIYKGILRWPVFNTMMLGLNPIVVSQTNPREDLTHVISEGHAALNRNSSIVIFPQGAREIEFRTQDFNSIGVKIAKHAKTPVIPIAIKTDAWSKNGFPIPYFGKFNTDKIVHISFGDPIYIVGNGRNEHEMIIHFIQDSLQKWCLEDKK